MKHLNRLLLPIFAAAGAVLFIPSCERETEAEDAMEDTGDAIEDAADDAGDAMDN